MAISRGFYGPELYLVITKPEHLLGFFVSGLVRFEGRSHRALEFSTSIVPYLEGVDDIIHNRDKLP